MLAKSTSAIAAEWRSNWRQSGYDYRKDHKERDRKVYMLRDNWAQAKGLVKPGAAGYYEDITSAGEEVFCFPGDSEVPFADNVEVAYRRLYDGPMTTLKLMSGSVLRATPNHPVLTDQGWVAIGALNKGDHVIEIADQVVRLFKENQNYTCMPVIQNIFSALNKNGTSDTLDLRPADFHGDGAQGNVNVVFATRPLSFGVDQMLQQFVFTYADATSFSSGTPQKRLLNVFRAAACFMRSGSPSFSRFRIRARHAFKHVLTAIADCTASAFNASFDRRPRHVIAFGQCEDAGAGFVFRAEQHAVNCDAIGEWADARRGRNQSSDIESTKPRR